MINPLIKLIRDLYQTNDFISLHEPKFGGNEKQYVVDSIESTFVSSVGKYVDQFEQQIESYTGCAKAVCTVNGTAALHVAIQLAGVKPGDEVISQALTFIATCNAISYTGAEPLFVDVDLDTMGLSPVALKRFLEANAEKREGGTFKGREEKTLRPQDGLAKIRLGFLRGMGDRLPKMSQKQILREHALRESESCSKL